VLGVAVELLESCIQKSCYGEFRSYLPGDRAAALLWPENIPIEPFKNFEPLDRVELPLPLSQGFFRYYIL